MGKAGLVSIGPHKFSSGHAWLVTGLWRVLHPVGGAAWSPRWPHVTLAPWSGKHVGVGPSSLHTCHCACVPQSLWSRHHGGSYQALVTKPLGVVGPAENASSGNSEVPVTPQVGGAAMLMWPLSISLFPKQDRKWAVGSVVISPNPT